MAKITKKNAEQVAKNLVNQVVENPHVRTSFAENLAELLKNAEERAALNSWMDDMDGDDAWGTEGQNDPRGDPRDD